MTEAKQNYLKTSVQYIKGVGEKRSRVLQETDIHTVLDLLYYFPRRYLDRRHITKISDVREGIETTVVGKVAFCGLKQGKRKRFILVLGDGTGFLNCVWFNRAEYWQRVFERGETVAFSGKVGYFGDPQMIHPEYDRLLDNNDQNFVNTGRIIPLYRSGDTLAKVGLDSRGFRRILRSVVSEYAPYVTETLPDDIRTRHGFVGLQTAIENVHFPLDETALRAARKRLKFDELYYLELMLALRRKNVETSHSGIEFLKVGDRKLAV
jgi:ATP-dependent DNA helicase RecG